MKIQAKQKKPLLRWGIERRLEFIEFRLYWDGRINRSDLKDFFGISVPQASNDLTKYQELAPNNMEYDRSQKIYVATTKMVPIFLSTDSESYFRELSKIATGLIDEQQSYAGWVPSFAVTPTLSRHVEPHTLFRILSAMKNKKSISISYQSMSNPEPTQRWIHPHALGFDGFRWHIRAYCDLREEFRDFLFSRIISIAAEEDSNVEPTEDREWYEYVDLVVGPHPDLSTSKKKVVELDYGMDDGKLEISVRGALFFYLCRRLGISEKSMSEPPETQHIVPLNWDDVIIQRKFLKKRSTKRRAQHA